MRRSNSCLAMFALILAFLPMFFGAGKAYSWWMWTPGDTVDNVGYKPTQPIPFSHKLHAGDKQIPCQYCHASARRSSVAGIPPLNTCMGCHKVIATDKDNIKFIAEHYKNNDPIVWTKVHDLPDYVRFPHKMHVAAGLACQDCHGPVQTMETVEQVAPLQMGWCVGCHKDRKVSVECSTCHY